MSQVKFTGCAFVEVKKYSIYWICITTKKKKKKRKQEPEDMGGMGVRGVAAVAAGKGMCMEK